MNTIDPFTAGIQVATIFSSLTLFIVVLYPALAGIVWQMFLGRLWPQYAQSKYDSRYSFRLEDRKGMILRLRLFPPPVSQFLIAVLSGFSLGMFFCQSREEISALLSFVLVVWFCYRLFIVSILPKHFIRVDFLFKYGKEVAIVAALFYALQSAGLLA